MIRFIWPLLIAVSIVLILRVDVGLGGIGSWLLPIGVIGGLIAVYRRQTNEDGSRPSGGFIVLALSWSITALCLFGLISTDGLDGLVYFWPSIISALVGFGLLVYNLVKK